VTMKSKKMKSQENINWNETSVGEWTI